MTLLHWLQITAALAQVAVAAFAVRMALVQLRETEARTARMQAKTRQMMEGVTFPKDWP